MVKKITRLLFWFAFASVLMACQPPLYYQQCGQLCVYCVPGKCEYTAIASKKERHYEQIEVKPGEVKALGVCSGDIVYLRAFWGNNIGRGYFLIPNQAPINATMEVSGTINHPYYQIIPNSCMGYHTAADDFKNSRACSTAGCH